MWKVQPLNYSPARGKAIYSSGAEILFDFLHRPIYEKRPDGTVRAVAKGEAPDPSRGELLRREYYVPFLRRDETEGAAQRRRMQQNRNGCEILWAWDDGRTDEHPTVQTVLPY